MFSAMCRARLCFINSMNNVQLVIQHVYPCSLITEQIANFLNPVSPPTKCAKITWTTPNSSSVGRSQQAGCIVLPFWPGFSHQHHKGTVVNASCEGTRGNFVLKYFLWKYSWITDLQVTQSHTKHSRNSNMHANCPESNGKNKLGKRRNKKNVNK